MNSNASAILLAHQAREAKQWGIAAKYYRIALSRRPFDARLWLELGHVLKLMGNYFHAEAAFRTAVDDDCTYADAHLQLGLLLKRLGRRDEARTSFFLALAIDPELQPARNELAGSDVSHEKLSELRSRLTLQRRKRQKRSAIALADRAQLTEQWELSLRLYNKVLVRNPNNSTVWIQRGHVLKQLGDEHRAEEAYRRAIIADPTNGDAHLQLAHVLKAKGNPRGAASAFIAAAIREPSFCFEISDQLSQLGWKKRAILELQSTLKSNQYSSFNSNNAAQQFEAKLAGLITTPELGDGRRLTAIDQFDPQWYLQQNPDVARAGLDPLEHFLSYGMVEGRKSNPEAAAGEALPVTAANIRCLKEPSFGGEVALFVTHMPRNRLKPNVLHYVASLTRQNIDVILIIQCDNVRMENFESDQLVLNGLFIRENRGYDFAAWAHLMRMYPQIYTAPTLYLLNDSVIGPLNDRLFGAVVEEIRSASADVISLTENLERGWHLQSYFIAVKSSGLKSPATQNFFNSIVSHKDKQTVINEYEVEFTRVLTAAEVRCVSIFHTEDDRNPTIYHWEELLEEGFPFIKLEVIKGLVPDVDVAAWQHLAGERGYDVALAEGTLKEAATPLATSSVPERILLSGLFDRDTYLSINQDVREAGLDAREHFLNQGIAEGRHFTSIRTVAELLLKMEGQLAADRRDYINRATLSIWTSDKTVRRGLTSQSYRIGVFCSGQGNFFMRPIALMLIAGLKSEGIDAVLRDELADKNEDFAVRIFVAPHEFFTLGRGRSWAAHAGAPNTALYNVEQIQTPWFCRALPLLISAPLVLDLNFQSAAILRNAGCNAVYLAPGYLPDTPFTEPVVDLSALELVKGYEFSATQYDWTIDNRIEARPIDVLFVGTRAARRDEVLTRLQHLSEDFIFVCLYPTNHVPITARNYSHASTRTACALAQRAKVVLNIHRDWLGYFEWARIVLQGIWQGACVVSDRGLPDPVFEAGVHYLEEDTNHIGELTRWLLESEDGRAKLDAVRFAGHERARGIGCMRVALAPVIAAIEKLVHQKESGCASTNGGRSYPLNSAG